MLESRGGESSESVDVSLVGSSSCKAFCGRSVGISGSVDGRVGCGGEGSWRKGDEACWKTGACVVFMSGSVGIDGKEGC